MAWENDIKGITRTSLEPNPSKVDPNSPVKGMTQEQIDAQLGKLNQDVERNMQEGNLTEANRIRADQVNLAMNAELAGFKPHPEIGINPNLPQT